MARNDEHRMANLRRRLDEISNYWQEIKCSPSKSKRRSQELNLQLAASNAARDLQTMFNADDGFGEWSLQVVDAFSLEPFPTYQPEPPTIVEDRHTSGSRQQLLTGFENPVQAGLQIILWAAAAKNPKLLLAPSAEWYQVANVRRSFKEWAAHLIVRRKGIFIVDPVPLKWIQAAFEQLEASLLGKADSSNRKKSVGRPPSSRT